MSDKPQRFVHGIIERCKTDKGFRAAMRRADNPSTEYQAWEILVSYGVSLEQDYERLAYATVGAALARSSPEKDGTYSLGEALARSGKDGKPGDGEKARLRRLLACSDSLELVDVLRPVLRLIESRSVPIKYEQLLWDILQFSNKPEKVKIRWAETFYYNRPLMVEEIPG
ncbi:MAG: type I-E CRISPR-associated protein Cse2/CasB [Spirochaetota bacterium]|jgi:CRISPR system Cascade subunit CasB